MTLSLSSHSLLVQNEALSATASLGLTTRTHPYGDDPWDLLEVCLASIGSLITQVELTGRVQQTSTSSWLTKNGSAQNSINKSQKLLLSQQIRSSNQHHKVTKHNQLLL